MITNFDLSPDGNIKVAPLTGYRTAIAAGMACLIRLEYAESDQDLRAQRFANVQLVLTPAQADELARALSGMSETVARQERSGVPQ